MSADMIESEEDDSTTIQDSEIVESEVLSKEPRTDEYQSILKDVIEQEKRLQIVSKRNSVLLPSMIRKTPCLFPTDQISYQFLSKGCDSISNSFKTYLSEKRTTKGVDAILQQCSQFFSFVKKNEFIDDAHQLEPYDLLLKICEQQPTLFNNFLSLLRSHGFQASTLLIRISSLLNLIDWFRMVCDTHFSNLTEVRQRLELERGFFQTIASRSNNQKTKEKFLEAREWIEDGIIGAQRLMHDSRPYYDALICLSKFQRLTSHQYSWALGFTLASLWVFAFNARSQSVERMTLNSWEDIKSNDFFLSSDFKTSPTFQYQIIAPTDILHLYVDNLRKSAILPEFDSKDAALFPTYNGTPLSSGEVSKKVEKIFKVYGYHITITKLRAMISTYIEEMKCLGKLTDQGS